MLDIKRIRKEAKRVEGLLQRKDATISLQSVLAVDEALRHVKSELEQLQSQRNVLSKEIGERKRHKEECTTLMNQVASISERVHTLTPQLNDLEQKLQQELSLLPNLPLEEVPISPNPGDNVCLLAWGEKPSFSFPFKNHLELNKEHQLFDFARGAKLSGSGWPVYCGMGAQLEWALLQFMVNHQLQRGFQLYLLPALVRRDIVYGSGQLPKFEHQQFKISDPDYELYLIPTAEVPLNGLHLDEILQEEQLPLRYTSYSPCFRREAGAAGAQERGLIRMHQFNKVEMFAFTKPEESAKLFDELVDSAEAILQSLGLHYRRMLLVTGDTSFAAARTIDIEVWLPGQNRYYEVSSISNCLDYQARRSQIRFRRADGSIELVHTLNGSGLATSRLLVALLENNQQADGSILLPEPLRPYLGGIDRLIPKGTASAV